MTLLRYNRFLTREVPVGSVMVGGRNPVRIQSMTTADTMDTEAVVRETIELHNAGCEIIRITAPGVSDAENLKNIKSELISRGCNAPLVADIHFSPRAALIAIEHVEKVRINPGNYSDKKLKEIKEYSEAQYEDDLRKAEETFRPLVLRAKELGKSLRIGVNHGSLSDRVLNKFGDTPAGMVESAVEFIQMAERQNFFNLIISMKASIPEVMVAAYRLLVKRFIDEGMNYPLHLGVTEAGDGNDGRIKSSMGIGSLLEDGLGDTIRVSLTEDSVYEIPVAEEIARRYSILSGKSSPGKTFTLHEKNRKRSEKPLFFREIQSADGSACGPVRIALAAGSLDVKNTVNPQCDFIFYKTKSLNDYTACRNFSASQEILHIPEIFLRKSEDLSLLREIFSRESGKPLSAVIHEDLIFQDAQLREIREIAGSAESPVPILFTLETADTSEIENKLDIFLNTIMPLSPAACSIRIKYREDDDPGITFCYRILQDKLKNFSSTPVIIRSLYRNADEALIHASLHAGGLLLSGMGDALCIETEDGSFEDIYSISLGILQAARLRINRAEFISCPSCGRTLFNLQETTKRIREKTGHLKGVKIAVMGCIVNGPGEMADADFGYVGAGPGKIHLYRGKEIVKKNIDASVADKMLIELIQESGRWQDP